jgi:hypothetical protein
MGKINKNSLKGDGLAFIKMSNREGINKYKQAKINNRNSIIIPYKTYQQFLM